MFVYEDGLPLGKGLIGKASMALRDFVDIGTNVQWVVIKDADSANVGEVCLVLRYTRIAWNGT